MTTGYTKDAAPFLYIHPIITADLKPRLYRNEFSAVLPFQEPRDFVKGRGLTKPQLEARLRECPSIMKQRCRKLIVEVAQTHGFYLENDCDPDEDLEDWCTNTDFPARLIPALLTVKRAMPALEEIKFIFWFGIWCVWPSDWEDYLKGLAQQWNAQIDLGSNKLNNQKPSEPRHDASEKENKSENPVKAADFDPFDTTLNETNKENPVERSLRLHIQFNLFDYHDYDAGDGRGNFIQAWDNFARGSSTSALSVSFSAMELNYWDDYDNGNYEGREYRPSGWDVPYIYETGRQERMREFLYKHYDLTETCKPLYVKPGPGHM